MPVLVAPDVSNDNIPRIYTLDEASQPRGSNEKSLSTQSCCPVLRHCVLSGTQPGLGLRHYGMLSGQRCTYPGLEL